MVGIVLQKSIYQYIRRDFIFKKNLYKRQKLFYLNSIECCMVLRNVLVFDSLRVLDSINILENLVGRKLLLINKRNRLYNKGQTVELKVIVKKERMFVVLMYLIYIYAPLFIKRFGNGDLIYKNKKVNLFTIKDKTMFNKSKFCKNIEECLNINLQILNSSQVDCLYLLYSLRLLVDIGGENIIKKI